MGGYVGVVAGVVGWAWCGGPKQMGVWAWVGMGVGGWIGYGDGRVDSVDGLGVTRISFHGVGWRLGSGGMGVTRPRGRLVAWSVGSGSGSG